jgi:hypothetical protein
MSTIAIPSLSAAGWIRSPAEKADALFSHFYESEKSQTYLYGTNVSSLPWIVEQYGHDINLLSVQLRSSLEFYLGRFYDSATVQITTDDKENNINLRITMSVYCSVIEEGKQYSFGKLLHLKNSKIERIMKLNNNDTE